MNELPRAIPEVKVWLALTPEELAAKMLFLLKKRNDAIVPTSNGKVDAYASGLTQLILDISSYFAP
jgi:hypothetical protein